MWLGLVTVGGRIRAHVERLFTYIYVLFLFTPKNICEHIGLCITLSAFRSENAITGDHLVSIR
jgi:hypothetical protein